MPYPFLQGYTPFAHETTKGQVLRHLRFEKFSLDVPTGEFYFTTPLSRLCSLTRVTKCPIQSKTFGPQHWKCMCIKPQSYQCLCLNAFSRNLQKDSAHEERFGNLTFLGRVVGSVWISSFLIVALVSSSLHKLIQPQQSCEIMHLESICDVERSFSLRRQMSASSNCCEVHVISFIRDTVKLRLEASKKASLVKCLVNVVILTSCPL